MAKRCFVVLQSVLVASLSCTQIVGIEEGLPLEPAQECSAIQDCVVTVPECREVTECRAGSCVFADAPAGSRVSAQTDGDCVTVVCDGSGAVRSEADPHDIEDDGEPCTIDRCDGASVVHEPTPEEAIPCYEGPPGTLGTGTCIAGLRFCRGGVSVGPCQGDVQPAPEDCDSGERDEDCDGASNESGTSCTCGDGFVSNDETCDDANDVSTDGCPLSCLTAYCGDGFVHDGSEVCDDGADPPADGCDRTCGGGAPVLQVAAGTFHVCVLLTEGRVKCWGADDSGQLGRGAPSAGAIGDQPGEMGPALAPVSLGTDAAAIAVAARGGRSCAILEGGSLKCWGSNSSGALGLGDVVPRGSAPGQMGDDLPVVDLGLGATVEAVAMGAGHTCALLAGGEVKCWGANDVGQLGLAGVTALGDAPGEMGDALAPVDLGGAAVAIGAGHQHTCAVLSGGEVKCWGGNLYGQLGLGDIQSRGDGVGEMGSALPIVALGPGVTATRVAGGANHTCALLEGGAIKCWGANWAGQLGLGDMSGRGDEPGEMGGSLPEVDLGLDVVVDELAVGLDHSCAVTSDGALKCWGQNVVGALGLGDTDSHGDNAGEMGDSLPAVELGTGRSALSVGLGNYHSCARLENGSVKCWGNGWVLGLGLDENQWIGSAPGEMGDALPHPLLHTETW